MEKKVKIIVYDIIKEVLEAMGEDCPIGSTLQQSLLAGIEKCRTQSDNLYYD